MSIKYSFALSPYQENRLYLMSIGAVFLLMFFSIWSWKTLANETDTLLQDYTECIKLESAIDQLKQKPAMAGSTELELAELSRLIERASVDSKIPLNHLVRIWPQQPQRVGDSVYMEKPTQVLLSGITLKQFTIFLHELSTSGGGLRIKSLRLLAPREDPHGNTWVVEATLTYLIYQPREQSNTHPKRTAELVQ